MKSKAKKIGAGICMLALGATLGGAGVYSHYVKSNLEESAVYCGRLNNIVGFPDWKINLPKFKNADVDDDGKFESILLYVNGDGQKTYQEVWEDNQGKLKVGRPYLYEE